MSISTGVHYTPERCIQNLNDVLCESLCLEAAPRQRMSVLPCNRILYSSIRSLCSLLQGEATRKPQLATVGDCQNYQAFFFQYPIAVPRVNRHHDRIPFLVRLEQGRVRIRLAMAGQVDETELACFLRGLKHFHCVSRNKDPAGTGDSILAWSACTMACIARHQHPFVPRIRAVVQDLPLKTGSARCASFEG